MPLWTIYHPTSTFTDPATKSALANAITAIYTAVPLPAFYVNVIFIPVPASNFYIGGVSRPSQPSSSTSEPGPDPQVPFIRICIRNIARKITTAQQRDRFLGRVDSALKPFIEDKGWDWEYDVEETSRDLWKIQGLVPPGPGTEAEETWKRENRASGFEAETGGLGKL
ncbi:putative oxalocrotonate tautomerase [Lophiotrema nucula]|uniref:Putative oxalocrotonate tautomerase n=1 Tax=Lophiotrema nucula TaxID=690887 RepID=A0A6A5YLX3_9PLEO|nr:putative oxalocrotonate tautomerase [Lophiotrema nucula]